MSSVRRTMRGLIATMAAGGLATTLVLGTGVSAAAPRARAATHAQASWRGFRWFEPSRAPAGWVSSTLPSGGDALFHPASLRSVLHDSRSIAFGRTDAKGRVLVYLNATPEQGGERLATWPAFRLQHNREESKDVHEDAQATGLPFVGGTGSCVIDEYVSRFHANPYREIACFVQGSTSSSVVVAAALRSRWNSAFPLLALAIKSYQVR